MNKKLLNATLNLGCALAICIPAIGFTQTAAGSSSSSVAVELVTATMRDGKVTSSRKRNLCIASGKFDAFTVVAQSAQDSDCKVQMAPSGAGSFFRLSCEAGRVSIAGSIKSQTDTAFVSSYVYNNGEAQIMRGTAGRVLGPCQ